jgi:hypothetical protein
VVLGEHVKKGTIRRQADYRNSAKMQTLVESSTNQRKRKENVRYRERKREAKNLIANLSLDNMVL